MALMDSPYNLSGLTNSTNVRDIVSFANNVTNGALTGLLMLAIFFIMLLALKKYEFENALLASSFSCFILGGILVYADLLNFIYPLFFLAAMAFTAFYMFVIKRNG